jgi:hypothetical protein
MSVCVYIYMYTHIHMMHEFSIGQKRKAKKQEKINSSSKDTYLRSQLLTGKVTLQYVVHVDVTHITPKVLSVAISPRVGRACHLIRNIQNSRSAWMQYTYFSDRAYVRAFDADAAVILFEASYTCTYTYTYTRADTSSHCSE